MVRGERVAGFTRQLGPCRTMGGPTRTGVRLSSAGSLTSGTGK